jgi:dTDP-4-dehydrorhamnose 3,5-epimerase
MPTDPCNGLPSGVKQIALTNHHDERGTLTEIFRSEWDSGVAPVQWNFVSSQANVMRGVHVHPRYSDYLILLQGKMLLGLHDIRAGSPTLGWHTLIELIQQPSVAVVIPPGVAHGFYFPEPTSFCYGLTYPWSLAEELGCRWDDPELKLSWPVSRPPLLSPRDATAGSLAEMKSAFYQVQQELRNQ